MQGGQVVKVVRCPQNENTLFRALNDNQKALHVHFYITTKFLIACMAMHAAQVCLTWKMLNYAFKSLVFMQMRNNDLEVTHGTCYFRPIPPLHNQLAKNLEIGYDKFRLKFPIHQRKFYNSIYVFTSILFSF